MLANVIYDSFPSRSHPEHDERVVWLWSTAPELDHLNGMLPTLMLLIPTVLFLLWEVKISALKRVHCHQILIQMLLNPALCTGHQLLPTEPWPPQTSEMYTNKYTMLLREITDRTVDSQADWLKKYVFRAFEAQQELCYFPSIVLYFLSVQPCDVTLKRSVCNYKTTAKGLLWLPSITPPGPTVHSHLQASKIVRRDCITGESILTGLL